MRKLEMKKTAILGILVLGSLNSYALDGKQFVRCFEAAVNQTISEYKTVVVREKLDVKTPSNLGDKAKAQEVTVTKGDTTRICNQLSDSSLKLIKGDFFEEYNGHEIPYDSEDILMATVGDLFNSMKAKINCYKPYTSQSGAIPSVVNKITEIRNTDLTRDALQKMISASIKTNFNKPLEEMNLNFCKSI
ncbi:MAG: hypothetical protein ACJAS4_003240 [Bacteriovoracaceae bacterium]|jgi:hypothetical protein